MGCLCGKESREQQQQNASQRGICISTCGSTRVIPDKKVRITGCTFMDTGYLVTVDFNNKRIKLYDTDLKCCSFVQSEYRPYDVCAIKDYLYVTYPKRKLIQKFRVTCKMGCIRRKLLNKHTFPTEGECRGIVSYTNDLIISLKFPTHANMRLTDSTWQIQIISIEGEVKRRFMHDSEGSALFQDARYIALTPSKREIVVSEAEDNRIKCLDMRTGELTFNHQMEDPKGVVCDKSGNIYVLGRQGVIRWILADREYSKILLKGTKGMNYSECITYFKKINTLAVPRNENRIEMYKIKNSIHDG